MLSRSRFCVLNPKALFPTYSRSIRITGGVGLGQLRQDVSHIRGDRGLGDVELTGNGGGGVAELLGGSLGVDPLKNQGRSTGRSVIDAHLQS